ncbi:hypothetical protein ACFZBP_13130 [Streptomyces sp. NPDC008086]
MLRARAIRRACRGVRNNALVTDGMQPIGLGAHLTSSDFAVDVTENL